MNLKFRLSLMNFLEFAVWGAYLTCMGNYLGVAGLGDKISWFYAIQGIVSIFMPTLMGIVADKYIQPQRLLGLCHLAAGGFMLGCWWLGMQAGYGNDNNDEFNVKQGSPCHISMTSDVFKVDDVESGNIKLGSGAKITDGETYVFTIDCSDPKNAIVTVAGGSTSGIQSSVRGA